MKNVFAGSNVPGRIINIILLVQSRFAFVANYARWRQPIMYERYTEFVMLFLSGEYLGTVYLEA